MLTDAHVHLDDPDMSDFVAILRMCRESKVCLISNSVDYESSLRNIALSRELRSVIPFVGIHPEIFARPSNVGISRESLSSSVERIGDLLQSAKGIGEIGIDPKYGSLEDQGYLLGEILKIAETTKLPVTFHCRDSISKILDLLTSYRIEGRVLFHWFAGTEPELRKVHGLGMYTSFGPPIIFSRRMAGLVVLSDLRYVLAETDSPTSYRSISESPATPFLLTSVIFKMGLDLGVSFQKISEILEENAQRYIASQH